MQTRYEEYHHTQGQIPFVLNDDLKRTVTLYSESRNWHENIEIQYCKVGEGFVVIDGTRYAFAKGDIAVIDSNSIHYTFSDTSMVYSCIIVGNEFWKQMGMDYNRFSFAPVFKDERVCCIFEEICDAYKGESELRVATLNYLLLKLLIEIVRGYSTPRTVEKTEKKDLITVKKVLLYIRENYNKKITLDLIATHTLIDKYTLCKVFKKVTNQTVFENMNAFRCIKAAEYISDGKSVSEAALLCGFENHSFFTKMFKRYVGVKPSEYRSALQ
jgi:AraC-like DNA-binding protein